MANVHKSEHAWGTEKELKYLTLEMGQIHKEVKRRTSKKTLLRNYIKAAKTRTNWGNINKKEVLERAEYLLEQLEKGGKK